MTALEFSRIKVAVMAMYSCSVNGSSFVDRNNVLAILGSFVDGATFSGGTVTVPTSNLVKEEK